MSEFDQSNLDLSTDTPSGPVECLGQTFESDDARREHYTELLREKLKDPEFRKIEGFPIGEDEDILALSDPPYYTACPNPWIEDFVKHHGRPYDPDEKYHREPFAADVSEGKTHPIYKAHSYHTKVPHLAIMRYMLHYTNPGDIVLDGFSGSGMTAVAGAACAHPEEEAKLQLEKSSESIRWGSRKVIINDLSPFATFIGSNYILPIELYSFEKSAREILSGLKDEYGWMYETVDPDTGNKCLIDYVVWSEVFNCSECGQEIVYLNEALDHKADKLLEEFKCPHCSLTLNKRKLTKTYSKTFDKILDKTVSKPKRKPIYLVYRESKQKKQKQLDENDFDVLNKIEDLEYPKIMPSEELPYMHMTHERARMDNAGVTHLHHFYLKRCALSLCYLWNSIENISSNRVKRMLKFFFEQAITSMDLQNRFRAKTYSHVNNKMPLVYYIPSQISEVSPWSVLENKLGRILKTFTNSCFSDRTSISSTGSSAAMKIPENSVDYIFTDPPFGENIYYADLNFQIESWHKVFTNSKTEAIIDRAKSKDLDHYRSLMKNVFNMYYFALKPGRWLTVEFSNSHAKVWNSIQTALQDVGFIVANVSALDKQMGSYRAVTTTTAVKQDLVISAYKPSKQLELIFSEKGDSVEGVWQFIDSHLKQLPVSKPKGGSLEFVAERDPRILYDRMVAFYIGHNTPVPLSSGEFQAALDDKYPARDGMVFLPEQVAQYDKLAAKMESVGQMVVFVEDEKSAIGWLRQYLKDKPSTYQGIHPDFTQQLSASWRKFETRPELSVLLDQNFLKYSGEGDVPSQIHGYLSTDYHDLRNLEKDDPKLQAKAKDRWYVPDPKKMADVEAQREKKLLAEFWEYAAQAGVERGQTQTSQASLPLGESAKKKPKVKKLKEVRTDAVRAGFMECQRNNQGAVILAVAEILPANVIEEDEQLQMIYDMAEMRAG